MNHRLSGRRIKDRRQSVSQEDDHDAGEVIDRSIGSCRKPTRPQLRSKLCEETPRQTQSDASCSTLTNPELRDHEEGMAPP